jgi:acyl-CoA oxidase
MMLMRIQIIEGSAPYVLKPLMIAARYTEQRRQFKTIPSSSEERKIIDYQATQTKLISAMAFAWVSKFMSYKCTIMYKAMIEEIHKKNKFKTMKDLHSLASAIKAYYMEECLFHAKVIRECTGAHGYLSVSELPEIIEMVAPNVTLEGDGCVMYQQTAKDIFKSVGRLTKGKQLKGTYSYLKELPNYIDSQLENKNFDDVTVLIDILKAATIYQIIDVGNHLRKKDGLSFDEKWNKVYLKDIINTAMLHSIYISAQTCYEALQRESMSKGLKANLMILCKIYASENIINHAEMALIKDYITGEDLLNIKELFYKLVEQYKPSLLPMCEAIALVDNTIPSVIGQKSGNVYEKLYNYASNTRLNTKSKF